MNVRASDEIGITYGTFIINWLISREYCNTSTMETHSETAYDKETGKYPSLREPCPQGNDETMMSMTCHGAVSEN